MNIDFFVQNVKKLSEEKGVTVTSALRESGAGRSMIDNIKKGSIPSLDRFLMLADYFDCTIDNLIGRESVELLELTSDERLLVETYRLADDRTRQMVDLALSPWKKPVQEGKAM